MQSHSKTKKSHKLYQRKKKGLIEVAALSLKLK